MESGGGGGGIGMDILPVPGTATQLVLWILFPVYLLINSLCLLSPLSLKYDETLSVGNSMFTMKRFSGSNSSLQSQKRLFSYSFLFSNLEFCCLLFSCSVSSFSILPHFVVAKDSTSDNLNSFIGAGEYRFKFKLKLKIKPERKSSLFKQLHTIDTNHNFYLKGFLLTRILILLTRYLPADISFLLSL